MKDSKAPKTVRIAATPLKQPVSLAKVNATIRRAQTDPAFALKASLYGSKIVRTAPANPARVKTK